HSGAAVDREKANFRDVVTQYDAECERVVAETVLAHFPHHTFLGEESVGAGAAASVAALSEKLAAGGEEEPMLWIVDPIDGTTNFAMGLPLAAVSVGVVHRGRVVAGVVYHPALDECFAAARGAGAFCNGRPLAPRRAPALGEAVVNVGFPPAPAALAACMRGLAAVRAEVRGLRMLACASLGLAWVADGRLSAYFSYDLNAWDLAAGLLLLEEAGAVMTDLRGAPAGVGTRHMLAAGGAGLHAAVLARLRAAGA
ncbi:unnamed protein product, partial [Heterosigma akashiwo]